MTDRARAQLILATGTAVSTTFGIHAIAPTLPLVQDVFGLNEFQVGLVMSAYVLPSVFLAVPLGVLADIFGRRALFAGAGVLYAVMGVAQAAAPTFEWLLILRTGQGVAFAAVMPLTVTLIGDAYSGLAQVRGQATRQVSMAMANLAVPMIGAQLALVAWFLPFAIQGVTIVPALAALAFLKPGRPPPRARRSYLGDALAAVRQRGFPSVLSLGFVRFFARFTALSYVPLDLVRRLEFSLTEVGIVMGVTSGLGFLSALSASNLVARVRPSRMMAGALTVVSLGLVAFALSTGLPTALAAAITYALGDGLISVVQSAYAARGAPDDVRAGLVALNGTARNAGKFIAPMIAGAVAGWAGISVALLIAASFVFTAGMFLTAGLSNFDSRLRDEEVEVEIP